MLCTPRQSGLSPQAGAVNKVIAAYGIRGACPGYNTAAAILLLSPEARCGYGRLGDESVKKHFED